MTTEVELKGRSILRRNNGSAGKMTDQDILARLQETLAARRGADPSASYTAKLFAKGPDSILKKIGEESAELIMAAKDGVAEKIVYESADLLYHLMVLLTFCDLSIEDVYRELRRREGVSGIEEKNSRAEKVSEHG